MTHLSRPTIKDVAIASGVSVTTVSHVLNEVAGKRVSPETRIRVLSCAEGLRYHPNPLARSLRTRRSHTIGLVFEAGPIGGLVGQLLLGAQHAAYQAGSLLLLHPGIAPQRGLELLADRQVDGIIYAAPSDGALWSPLPGLPMVVLGRGVQDYTTSSVVADDRGGARAVVDMLLAAGHRRIGLLQDLTARASCRDLALAAYADALAGYDLPVDPHLLGAVDLLGTSLVAIDLLSRPDPPTALVCGSDLTAVGVYQAAERLGLGIPRDLSVVAFAETLGLGAVLQPGLTAVALPYADMGRWAVANLVGQIVSADPPPVLHHVLATTVVRRGSTGPPAAGSGQGGQHQHTGPQSGWSSDRADYVVTSTQPVLS
jgi:LacI family transcriptional regulator